MSEIKEIPSDYTPPSWDVSFFRDVYEIASKSKDPRTKIGAVLVHWKEKLPIMKSYNGIAMGVKDLADRMVRPEKYFWMSHAERNTIFLSARKGKATEGTTMFTQGLPCSECADGVIQAGICEVVIHKQWNDYEQTFNWEKWIDSSKRSKIKFEEAGVKVRVFDGLVNREGYLDGKIITL